MVFPGVKALDGVNFEARPGEILALMGENGAGKSTLMKVLSGVIPSPRYQGQIFLDGKEQRYKSTMQAREAGVAIIHQELNMFPDLSVSENMFLTMEPLHLKALGIIDERTRDQLARDRLRDIGVNINVNRPLSDLSVGNQQLVEILRALATNANVLIFDEPTSALTHQESETLFRILGELRTQGKTIIYISHRMEEVFRLADRIVVLRDGQSVGGGTAQELNSQKVITLMVGRNITELYPKRSSHAGKEVLKVESLNVSPVGKSDPHVNNVSFEVHAGEILGIAGLVGSGRSELISALFGALAPKRVTANVWINGKKVAVRSPAEAIHAGLALVTEDRKESGLVLDRSVEENLALAAIKQLSPHFSMDRHKTHTLVVDYIKKLRIKTSSSKVEVRTLSGGNQQKIVLAKWLATNPKVLFLDEPTRGIDVGARQEIYSLIDMLAAQGMAIVMVSSDLPEVLGMSDRVLVMRDGQKMGILDRAQANQESVMRLAAGVS